MLPVQNATKLSESLLQSRAAAPLSQSAEDPQHLFTDVLRTAQHEIRSVDLAAQHAVSGLLSGTGVDVHEAMIATQRADITFELALQVRNKAVAAYQQMMGMQF